ncbi:MAG TPA: sulfurtransferase TusA family protein [Geminicoccaceae bacterium]|nr:sulfurtransferase TusA family protein [Geminicoccaceae bacterium]
MRHVSDPELRMSDITLDMRGLKCPLPVLRARKAMQGAAPGAVLRIVATDPGTVRDFQAFCQATGHILVEQAERDGEFSFRIRKAG